VNVKVGTFNLNNLFSRFDFSAEIDLTKPGPPIETRTTFDFTDPRSFAIREFRGKLIRPKPQSEQDAIAQRIKAMDLDVLAVQEVEDISTLRAFNANQLGGLYPHVTLLEGNDPRLIDVGILSKLPLGAVITWKHAVDPADPTSPVFSRDMLQAQILNDARSRTLLWLFNNHLKSKLVPFGLDPAAETARSNELRRRQAETAARIITEQMRPNSRFVVLGDMNDGPDSQFLAPLVASSGVGLVNALAQARESRPAPTETPAAPSVLWTERFKPSGKPAEHNLFDQVWVSPSLGSRLVDATIDRRTTLGGDGSDHDPSWITLQL
jgi:endonuclease/exonuclease/phosphatase family metal-dependent hydrolase